MKNLTGQTIGRYTVIEQLGEGGMATVYKAFDNRLERYVALKVIIPYQQQAELFLKRFDREARALAQLNHPNIVRVYDYGEHEGMPYLVMAYIPGGTLKPQLGKPMDWREAARLLAPIARSLHYAHQHGIVHRDVKPANVLIDEENRPMLSDFGIARLIQGDENTSTNLTGTGVGIGTPDYMAPEQGIGGQVDFHADIYSLGIVFYELVTGRRPFRADTPMAVIFKHATEPLPRPKDFNPSLPDIVEGVIFKAAAKHPADRYADMSAFADVLDKLAQGTIKLAPTDVSATIPLGQIGAVPGTPFVATGSRLPTMDQTIRPPRYSEAAPNTGMRQPTQPTAPPAKARLPGWAWAAGGIGGAVLLVGLCLIAYFIYNNLIKGALPATTPTATLSVLLKRSPTPKLSPASATPGSNPTAEATATRSTIATPASPAATAVPPTRTAAATQAVPTNTPPPTLTFTNTPIPRPASARVLWDTSHGPRQGQAGSYEPSGVFSDLVSLLAKDKVTVEGGSLASADLKRYAAVVISATSATTSAYTPAEAQMLVQYIENGGGLLILGEDPNFTDTLSAVSSLLGVTLFKAPVLNKVTNLSKHPVFTGISTLEFYSGGSLQLYNSQAQIIAQENGAGAVAVDTRGSGRVVIIGDSNLFDNRWIPPNQQFASNVFRWITQLMD